MLVRDFSGLSIDFCGVTCENPFFLSSSCVSGTEEMCARALEAGWGGVVFKTIGFYRAREVSPRFDVIHKEGAAFVGFRNMEQISEHSLEQNLLALEHLKRRFPQKVIVASIMGETTEEWTRLAELAGQAGADIIECNFSCPQMAVSSMGADVGVNPELVKAYCRAVRAGTRLPVLAKMTPNITDILLPARAAVAGGATGISAINTVKSISSLDDCQQIQPDIAGYSCISGYSGKAVKPIALRFVGELACCPELQGVPISGIGGIENWRDALDFILLGAGNVQVTTSIMQYGYRIIDDLKDGLCSYMRKRGMQQLSSLVGGALERLRTSRELDRNSIVYPVFDQNRCVGCGRCYVSCQDGGHQAIAWNSQRQPMWHKDACVGCHLCRLVCPTGAITSGTRELKP